MAITLYDFVVVFIEIKYVHLFNEVDEYFNEYARLESQ